MITVLIFLMLLFNVNAHAGENVQLWNKVIENNQKAEEVDKIVAAHMFMNTFKYKSDSDLWGTNDYWATPMQMLKSGGGDCEDYAIAKYFMLRHMGVDDDKLKITYVVKENLGHMVLLYYPIKDKEPFVLDNLMWEILPLSHRKDLQTVYAFNNRTFWIMADGKTRKIGNGTRLKLWQNVLNRIQGEMLSAN